MEDLQNGQMSKEEIEQRYKQMEEEKVLKKKQRAILASEKRYAKLKALENQKDSRIDELITKIEQLALQNSQLTQEFTNMKQIKEEKKKLKEEKLKQKNIKEEINNELQQKLSKQNQILDQKLNLIVDMKQGTDQIDIKNLSLQDRLNLAKQQKKK